MPKFMVFMPGNAESEAGALPPAEIITAMTAYNEQLAKAGVLLAAEGLKPTSAAAKVRFDDGERRTVVDGPFTEAKELVAGFWLLQASSLQEALEWVKRAPLAGGATLEVRPVFETDELGPEFSAAVRKGEQRVGG
jgi:hypothetical protein